MSITVFNSGVLPSATPVVASMLGAPLPVTITLKSADVTRNVQLSTDGGTEYFSPAFDQTTATMLVLVVTSNITHIKITGVANDTWRVL